MLQPVVGAVVWVAVGCLVLYARSRGWTRAWEERHPAASTVVLGVVLCAAAGWAVFLVALGAVLASQSAIAVPWTVSRAFEAVVVAAAWLLAGRMSGAVRMHERRSRVRVYVAVMLAIVALQWLVTGAGVLPWAVTLGLIALFAFSVGSRTLRGPSPAGD